MPRRRSSVTSKAGREHEKAAKEQDWLADRADAGIKFWSGSGVSNYGAMKGTDLYARGNRSDILRASKRMATQRIAAARHRGEAIKANAAKKAAMRARKKVSK
jgi:hypothetical protein